MQRSRTLGPRPGPVHSAEDHSGKASVTPTLRGGHRQLVDRLPDGAVGEAWVTEQVSQPRLKRSDGLEILRCPGVTVGHAGVTREDCSRLLDDLDCSRKACSLRELQTYDPGPWS